MAVTPQSFALKYTTVGYLQDMKPAFYTTFISVDLAHHDIVRATVGKGGITVPI